jgi:glucosamine 6-phosphate synthetase-like amidotransferase/phosphosugar isomerase protein
LTANFDVSEGLTDAQKNARIIKLPQNEDSSELGNFPHYMLKEIFQQPRAIGQVLI